MDILAERLQCGSVFRCSDELGEAFIASFPVHWYNYRGQVS